MFWGILSLFIKVLSNIPEPISIKKAEQYARVVDDLISHDMQKIMGMYGASPGATPPSDIVSLSN